MARKGRTEDVTVITDAPMAHSDDLEMRQRRYAITMIIRTTCFFMIFFVHGWARVVCVGLAAILPARQAAQRRYRLLQIIDHRDHIWLPFYILRQSPDCSKAWAAR